MTIPAYQPATHDSPCPSCGSRLNVNQHYPGEGNRYYCPSCDVEWWVPLPRAVVALSGGAGSWAAGRRWIEQNGTDGLALLFTDVSDGSSPHLGEDADTLRFLRDAADNLGAPLITLRDGRSIYDVFREKRWLGNSSLAHCSWELKTKPAREWMDAHAAPDAEVVVGIDWTETHRIDAIRERWLPYRAVFPLCERPYLAKPQVLDWLRREGLRPPRMYALGFAHANCRVCVKAGQSHMARVLEVWPETYAYHEAREQEMRDGLGDVAMLRDRSGGETVPLTLRAFRERVEAGRQPDLFDEGGCGCFTDLGDEPQENAPTGVAS